MSTSSEMEGEIRSGEEQENSPKGTAWMDHPVAGSFLSDPLLHQRLFAAEELHGEPVVGRLEPCLQLILEEV